MFIMSWNCNNAININQITNMYVAKRMEDTMKWVIYIDTTTTQFIIYNRFDDEVDAKNALRSLVDTLNLEHKVNY